jgi:hypothetical protein
LIFNALRILPTAKKLCLAREFFLDTHGERGAARSLAHAALYDTGKRPRVDCHNYFAHVKMMRANVIKGMANAMKAQGYHHKGKRPNFASRFSRATSTARK